MDRDTQMSTDADSWPSTVDRIAVWVAFVGVFAFLISLFLPAFDCGPYQKSGTGLGVLAFGVLGLVFGDLRWLANPLFVLMNFRLFSVGIGWVFPESNREPQSGKLFWLLPPILASILALASLIEPAEVCGDEGSGFRMSDGLLSGGYFWVCSMLLTSLFSFFREIVCLVATRGEIR